MKKVFRTSKYIEQMYKSGLWQMAFETIVNFPWPRLCEGKTEEEIHKLGYGVVSCWLVEEED